jgi:predicted transcriptional regulator
MPRRASAQQDVKVSTSEEAELAVKTYLATLGKPKPRGRQARPKPDFEAATKGITDPLAKLAAIKAERERVANAVVGNTAEEAFIQYGKTWARIHDYAREDFAALGVPKRVLDATFGGAGGGAPKAPAARVRARRVNPQDLAAAVTAKPAGAWVTVADVMREVGGSPATVRKVLDELSAAGTLTDAFDDQKHTGRGRAPKVWERN